MICRKTSTTACVFVINMVLALLLLTGSVGAVPVEEWNKTFGGKSDDMVMFAQQISDGGYILAGYTFSYGAGDGDAWLIKTDAKGNEQWNKTFGYKRANLASFVQQTSDGGYIIAGSKKPFWYGSDALDAWLIKTDAKGNEQWNKTFGGNDDDRAITVKQTHDGGYIIAGATQSYGVGGYDAWLIKTDVKGNEQWNKTFGGTGWDWATAIQQTFDGGYILAGCTNSPCGGFGSGDAWLIKTDAYGNEQWNKTFIKESDGAAYSVQQTSDKGYVLAGSMGKKAWLIKTDSDGNQQWSKTFGGVGKEGDQANSVQQTSDEGYVLAGFTSSYGNGGRDAWLIKTDANGNEQWNKIFGGVKSDSAWSVEQTTDGRYILAGVTNSSGAANYDAWLIKVRDTNAGANKKSTPGFEILVAMISLVILFSLKREKS